MSVGSAQKTNSLPGTLGNRMATVICPRGTAERTSNCRLWSSWMTLRGVGTGDRTSNAIIEPIYRAAVREQGIRHRLPNAE